MLDCNIPMFEGALQDLDTNKRDFIAWCKYYNHHVFSKESLDRPDDFTVGCDILLDDWVERKLFKDKNESRGMKSASNSQQVINF